MQLGIIDGTQEEFDGLPGISTTGLMTLAISPLHYWSKYLDPNREAAVPTDDMMVGSAIHCAVFQPDEFPYKYAVMPEGVDRRSKIGKELYAELTAEGKRPIKANQYETILGTAEAAKSHPAVRYLLSKGGLIEKSIRWKDQASGVVCKSRLDYALEPCSEFPNGLILDLKSSHDAGPESFSRAAHAYGYHIQSAMYPDGFQAIYGTVEPPAFLFCVTEKERPHAVKVYSASEAMIRLGRLKYRPLLKLFAECSASGEWPGYSTTIDPLPLSYSGDKELHELEGTN